jgi:hypothetical protein
MTDDRKTHFNKNQGQNQDRPIGVMDEDEIIVGPDGLSRKKKEIKHFIDRITGRPCRVVIIYEEHLICTNPLGLHELDREIDPIVAKEIDGKLICLECFQTNKKRKLLNQLLGWIIEWETIEGKNNAD